MSRQGATGDSRERLVDATVNLLCRQGFEATVVKDIARVGSAPMGSFYYHFPGGKEELGAVAMRRGADRVGETFATAMAAHADPGDALAACVLAIAAQLETTSWEDGCPIATTALETVGRSPVLQQVAAEAFAGWQQVLAEGLGALGLGSAAAQDLAHTAVALIEGAEMIARVQRSREPLDRAAVALRTLADAGGRAS
jgi:TetR/AcrR family transcriptional repressor of lmrAB and yxaGH operons